MKRRQSRQIALEMFYALELSGDSKARVLKEFPSDSDYALAIFEWAIKMKEDLDVQLEGLLSNWSMDRISKIDKGLIYLACAELKLGRVPVNIVIDEYVELAKVFGDKEAPAFINGMIDSWYKGFMLGGCDGEKKA